MLDRFLLPLSQHLGLQIIRYLRHERYVLASILHFLLGDILSYKQVSECATGHQPRFCLFSPFLRWASVHGDHCFSSAHLLACVRGRGIRTALSDPYIFFEVMLPPIDPKSQGPCRRVNSWAGIPPCGSPRRILPCTDHFPFFDSLADNFAICATTFMTCRARRRYTVFSTATFKIATYAFVKSSCRHTALSSSPQDAGRLRISRC